MKLTLPGSVASPALAASCNNHHGKRKCCTMTWGERSVIASSGEGRTAPSSSSAHHPGTSIPHSPVPQWLLVLLEPGALAVFPGLNQESHHLNVPLRVGGAAWSGNTLLPLQVLLGQLNFCHHCHQQNRGVNSLMHPAQHWLVSIALQDGIWAERGQEKDVECASAAGKKHSQWRKAMPAEV